MKRNTICGAYSDYAPENRTKRGTYNTRNAPARDTRHFAVAKVENNSKEAHVEYAVAKCLSWQIIQILCTPIFSAIR